MNLKGALLKSAIEVLIFPDVLYLYFSDVKSVGFESCTRITSAY